MGWSGRNSTWRTAARWGKNIVGDYERRYGSMGMENICGIDQHNLGEINSI